MRRYLGLLLMGTLVATTACKVSKSDEPNDGQGGGGSGPGSGASGGGGPCGAVPAEGECITDTKIRSCFIPDGEDARVIEVDCAEGEVCAVVNGFASCKPSGDCYEGETECVNDTTVRTCVSGAWQESSCGSDKCLSQPGQGAECAPQAPGSGIFLRGHLEYEYVKKRADLKDYETTVSQEAAVDFFITVYDLDTNELIGLGLTSPGQGGLNPGDWEIELDRKPTGNTFYYFWPMLFDNNGNPRMAIAKAKSNDPIAQYSDEYWSFGFGPVCDKAGECDVTDVGTNVITEDMGSGAAHIYQWLDYGIFRVGELVPSVQPLTFAVFWAPNNEFTCGSCFVPPVGGGANVLYDPANDLSDHYATAMNITGSSGTPAHWGQSTINHEFGHWVMSSYSRSPGEGGKHYVDEASLPGLAYSEGWATFCGQSNMSNGPSDNNPIYFAKQQGTSFWVDINSNNYSGGPLVLPDPNGPIDQFINENVVASMMWSLWATSNAQNPQGLGDSPLFSTLPHERLVGGHNRGYFKLDFVDYLDAMKCAGTANASQISAVVGPIGYPYDNAELCP